MGPCSLGFQRSSRPLSVRSEDIHFPRSSVAGHVWYWQFNYRLFSQFVGFGEVRKQFEEG